MLFFNNAKKRENGHAGRWQGALPWKVKDRREPPRERAVASRPGEEPAAGDETVIGASLAPGPETTREVVEVRGVDLKSRIGTASFAFRGYDVSNLGKSPELLAHPAYGTIVRGFLDEASQISAETLGRPVDLAARIEARAPTELETFAEDVATIVSMELAQLKLLEEFFGVPVGTARQSFGYSIGELASMVAGGVFTLEELLPVPLACADDSAELARDTTLGVIFSRGPAIVLKDVQDLCTSVSSEGQGMVGVSSYLSPNTVLVIGQGDTLDRLDRAMPAFLPDKTMLRRKPHKLPPLHTPLVWQRNIPNRAAVALYKIPGHLKPPSPKVVSCVTGTASYDALNARDTLIRWIDHPQLLWDVITETLGENVDLLVHAGPAPNLIPATFERLSNNIAKQFGNRYFQRIGREVGSRMNKYAWLSRMLPSKAALLRAPHVEHVILEDWLLEQTVA
jgi:[acyl-carrier-protein] S-malonyltransferase